jgi:uncharacterized protein YjbJ (UPF0337 family)
LISSIPITVFTDDDLDLAAGKFEVLAGILQEKFGFTLEAAYAEIEKRVTHLNPV